MLILPSVVYSFIVISIKILCALCKSRKIHAKIHMGLLKDSQIVKTAWGKEKKCWKSPISWFQNVLQSNYNKRMWYLHKYTSGIEIELNRNTSTNKIALNPFVCGQSIFDKAAETCVRQLSTTLII